ncbi:hypothetical protein FRC11_008538, partial [Ceratobasidium sp. 423]
MFVLASEQMLMQAQANNARHDYISDPLSNQEPNDDKEDLSPADQLLDHLLICDGIDYHAQYLSDHSSDVSPDPTSLGDDVHHPDPEPLGHNMIEPNANSPTSPQVVPEPITTNWFSVLTNHPQITIAPHAGTIVQSQFARNSYNPTANAVHVSTDNQGPATQPVPPRQPTPLRRTDHDTIVPGTPHPMPRDIGGQPASGGVPVGTTHRQTTLLQAGQPSVTTALMTPTAPRPRKGRPPQMASQPALGSNMSSGSAPIMTPTPVHATLTATGNHNQQSIGQGHINFTNSNDQVPAMHRLDPNHMQCLYQPWVASPTLNPFLDLSGLNATRTMPMGQNVPPITSNDAPPTMQVAQPAQPLAYHSLSMADHAVPMVMRQALVMHNDVPADYQAAILTQSTQFAGSHSHLSVPQGVTQPQVQPQLAYPQLTGTPPQPHALTAQPYALPPLPARHGHAQQNTQAPRCLYIPQHMQGCEGANHAYGPQYGHTPQVQDSTYPLPYVPSAQAHGGQAAMHQHLQLQMGPAPPPPAPAPFAPHGASQVAPQVDPCGVMSGVAVCPEGAPPAAPPGIGMDIDIGGGKEPTDNPAPEGGFPN